MEQKEIARLLRAFAELIDRSSAADMESLLSGRASLQILGSSEHDKRTHAITRRPLAANRDMRETVELLQSLESRDEGIALLKNSNLSKKDLESAARLMDLPVIRDDDSERLMQKLVESSIGARLNSRAIRG